MIKLIKLILELAGYMTEYASNKQMIDAGKAMAVSEGLKHAVTAINRADRIRDDYDSSFDSSGGVLDESDPNLRD